MTATVFAADTRALLSFNGTEMILVEDKRIGFILPGGDSHFTKELPTCMEDGRFEVNPVGDRGVQITLGNVAYWFVSLRRFLNVMRMTNTIKRGMMELLYMATRNEQG